MPKPFTFKATPSQDLFLCPTCEKPLTLDNFYVRVDRPNRPRQSECIECFKVRQRRNYAAKHTEFRLKAKLRQAKRRIHDKHAVFMHYGGYVCACCGETEKLFLQLDHIENDGGHFRRNVIKAKTGNGAGEETYAWIIKNNFPPGFQVLCANCNWGKRMNKGVCPHHNKEIRCNDYGQVPVGSSEPKRVTPLVGEEIVWTLEKSRAVLINQEWAEKYFGLSSILN